MASCLRPGHLRACATRRAKHGPQSFASRAGLVGTARGQRDGRSIHERGARARNVKMLRTLGTPRSGQ
eukprot:365934-Chlamydomonas_euryale.AAC.8